MADVTRHGSEGQRDFAGGDALPPLVEAKLAVPSVRRDMVERRGFAGRSTPAVTRR
jgi:hypothetical protein